MNITLDSQLLVREQPRNLPENARARGTFSDRLHDALGKTPTASAEPKSAKSVLDVTDVVKTAAAEQPADAINTMMMVLNNPADGVVDANGDGVVNVLDIVKNSQAISPDEPTTSKSELAGDAGYPDIKNVVATISAGKTAEAMNMMAWTLYGGTTSTLDGNGDGTINVQDVVLNTTQEPVLADASPAVSADVMAVVQSINQKQPVDTMANMAAVLYGAGGSHQDMNLDGKVDILDLVKMTASA